MPRDWSPSPGRSILMTSAPRSASRRPAEGPAMMWPSSRTRRPSSGSALVMSPRIVLQREELVLERQQRRSQRSLVRVLRRDPVRDLPPTAAPDENAITRRGGQAHIGAAAPRALAMLQREVAKLGVGACHHAPVGQGRLVTEHLLRFYRDRLDRAASAVRRNARRSVLCKAGIQWLFRYLSGGASEECCAAGQEQQNPCCHD